MAVTVATTLTVPRVIIAGLLAVGLALALGLPWPTAMRARQITGYLPVTDERLRTPEPDNWLMYRRTYNGWGYSPLRQIRSQNVVDLRPAWVFSTGVYDEHHQAPPIVNAGRMFVTTGAQVIALDATNGDLLWRYVRELPQDLRRPHSTNRGVGLYDDRVYVGTLDAHVVALDATSGTVVWERAVEDYKLGYYITMDHNGAIGGRRQGDGGHLWRRAGYSRVSDRARRGDR